MPPRRPARRNEEQETLTIRKGEYDEPIVGYRRTRVPPPERPKRKPTNLRKLLYIATLINPVDHRLYTVVWNEGEIEIISPTNEDEIEVWGKGLLAEEDFPAQETNCPRTHTPSGVVAKGRGLGLILYSGLALAAAISTKMSRTERREYDLPADMEACISSSDEGPGRSTEASRWWKKQVELGFARESGVQGECEGESIHGEVDADNVYDEDKILEELDRAGDISDIDGQLRGTIHFTFCPRDMDAQVIEATTIFAKGLVFDWNDRLKDFADDAPTLTKEILLEMNLGGITEPHLLELFLGYLHETDATEEEIDAFLRENDLVDQPRLPGIELGEPTPYAKFKKNARRDGTGHSRTWRKAFEGLTDDIG